MAALGQMLDDTSVERLRQHWITTVEDLVSALEADEASVGRLLNMSIPAVEQLHKQALEAVEPEFRMAIQEEKAHVRQYGARQPAEC